MQARGGSGKERRRRRGRRKWVGSEPWARLQSNANTGFCGMGAQREGHVLVQCAEAVPSLRDSFTSRLYVIWADGVGERPRQPASARCLRREAKESSLEVSPLAFFRRALRVTVPCKIRQISVLQGAVMVKKPFPANSSAKPPIDGDGYSLQNKILLTLPPKELGHVLSKLEFVRLQLHQVIHEAGEAIKSVYFVNRGLISILAVQPDGKTVEVGLIGNEGLDR